MDPQTENGVRLHRHEQLVTGRPEISRWLAAILRPIHAWFMKWYFQIEVVGEHNLPPSGSFILAPLHRSRWDPFMLYCAVKSRLLYFMISHDEATGLQGWLVRRLGAIPINTQRPAASVIRSCKETVSRGDALVIFPEGNLFYYQPGEVHPLKQGVAWLALSFRKSRDADEIPVIPVRLVYSRRLLRARSRAKIVVGKPLNVGEFARLPSKEGISALTSALQDALGDVVNETSSAESLRCATLSR